MQTKTVDLDTGKGHPDTQTREILIRRNPLIRFGIGLYDLGWRLAIPALRQHHRLAEGYDQRRLRQWADAPVDIWLQAASAGESYLAASLLAELRPPRPLRILVTTNTSQGMEILVGAAGQPAATSIGLSIQAAYFPFDRPTLMARAVRHLRPQLAILLETELWPGHLTALKTARIPIMVVNGRLTAKSLKGYLSWPALWRQLSPDRILAVSRGDARRFAALFDRARVEIMPNMKFDRQETVSPSRLDSVALESLLNPDTPFLILGSVREGEEPLVTQMIQALRQQVPDAVIGLFPRHMHRVTPWVNRLHKLDVPCRLRSLLTEPVSPGTVIVWDAFGELSGAYGHCRACFIGGSLVPLGGQNFLEPLSRGVRPVIGPHWKNFAWVGKEIVEEGLVRQAQNWQQAVAALVAEVNNPPERGAQQIEGRAYMDARRGGTACVCRLIEKHMA